MLEFLMYVVRNPAEVTRGTRRLSAVRKAMKAHKAEHPACAWCGREKKTEVHHIIPVSVAPGIAASRDNMLTLCRKPACHQVIGHNGDFGGRYVMNVKRVCEKNAMMVVKTIRRP